MHVYTTDRDEHLCGKVGVWSYSCADFDSSGLCLNDVKQVAVRAYCLQTRS